MAYPRLFAALILAGCIAALGGALTAQFDFGLRPCILCLYQRVPFVISGLLAATALLPSMPPRTRMLLLGLCALAFLANTGIAFFHVGVEQHWWAGTAACTGGQPAALSIADLQAQLTAKPPARCDEIPWSLFGISMAGYNVPYSLALAVFAAIGARRQTLQVRP